MFCRRYCEIGGGCCEPSRTSRSLLPGSVGDGVWRRLDRLKHSGGVSTAWLQVILTLLHTFNGTFALVSITDYIKPFFLQCRSGETLPEGADVTRSPGLGMGSGPIHLDQVSCTGKEPSLLLCVRSEWLQHDCTHHEDVNIACSPQRSGQSLSKNQFSLHETQTESVAGHIQAGLPGNFCSRFMM